MGQRYYEDFETGERVDLGSRTVTESDIVSFAEQYDPQSFHVDREAAAETEYGQLFASGWHTAAICMRQLVEGLLAESAVVAGVGVDALRWKRPVFGGDELSVTAEILDREVWNEDSGLVRIEVEATTDDGELAIRFEDLALLERASD